MASASNSNGDNEYQEFSDRVVPVLNGQFQNPELVRDGFIDGYASFREARENGKAFTNPVGWVLVVSRNKILASLKRERRSGQKNSHEMLEIILDLHAVRSAMSLSREDPRLDALRECLKQLKNNPKTLRKWLNIYYHFFEELSREDTAAAIGATFSAANTERSRTLVALASCIDKRLAQAAKK